MIIEENGPSCGSEYGYDSTPSTFHPQSPFPSPLQHYGAFVGAPDPHYFQTSGTSTPYEDHKIYPIEQYAPNFDRDIPHYAPVLPGFSSRSQAESNDVPSSSDLAWLTIYPRKYYAATPQSNTTSPGSSDAHSSHVLPSLPDSAPAGPTPKSEAPQKPARRRKGEKGRHVVRRKPTVARYDPSIAYPTNATHEFVAHTQVSTSVLELSSYSLQVL